MLAILLAIVPLAVSQMMAGGPMMVDVNRDDIQKMSTFALGELNTLLGAENTLVKVLAAKTQVVAGINYILSLQLNQDGATKICNVTVWSREWMHDTRLTHHVCSARKRDVLVGGPVTTNVHRADVREMAGFALSEMNLLTGLKNTLTEITSAKTQVVAGTNYIMTFRISDGTNTQTCDVTVWYQAWTSTKTLTQHKCSATSRRQIGMPGGFTTVDTHSDEIQNMASFALTELNGLQGTKATLNQVISAKTQVVAGINYKMTIRISDGTNTQTCDVTVWYQAWTGTKQMTHHHCKATSRRQIGMPGGFTTVDIHSDEIQNMASFALTELNGLRGTKATLNQVISAKTQVVAGINYKMTIRISDGTNTQTCNVTVWYQAWTNTKQMTHHHCKATSRRQIGMPGGFTTVDVHSDEIQNMASFALTELNGLRGTKATLNQVISAKTQVVAGINYKMTIRISDGINTQTCNVTVWYQAWTNTKQMTHHHCKATNRRQIGMPGGITTVDIHSDEIQKMASFALTELNGLRGTKATLDQVISAKTQVVAGWNYFLSIRTKTSSGTEICNVTIWSQPWLHKVQMTQHHCYKVAKRAGPLLGATHIVDVNNAEVQKLAAFAVSEINGLQHAQNSLVKVLNARTQEVAGYNYFLKLSLQSGGKTQICDVEIWVQSWTKTQDLLMHHCSAAATRRSILGGVEPASLSEPIQKAVSFAEDALNAKSNNLFRMVTEKVDHITRQIVAGMKYSFEVTLVTSTCTNGDDSKGKGLDQCPANTGTLMQHQTCTVSVLYQAWATPHYQLVSDTCGPFS